MTSSSGRAAFTPYYEGLLGGGLFRWLDWAKLRVVRRAAPHPVRRLLDLGCGNGRIAGALRGQAALVVGLDHEPGLIAATRARGVAGVIGDFDQRLPFLDGALDLVVMADTIEHTRTPREIVREVRRVLAPGGTFVVFTPPYDRVRWVLAEKGHHLLTRRPADHISPFTHEALHYLLAEFFARREVGTVNFGLTMFGVASGRRDG